MVRLVAARPIATPRCLTNKKGDVQSPRAFRRTSVGRYSISSYSGSVRNSANASCVLICAKIWAARS